MKTPFDFFDKIFCINLQKRTDRWNECLKIFKLLNIFERVERFEAINFNENNSVDPRIKGRCGCTQSHLNLILEAREKKYKNILIFEDDINIHAPTNIVNEVLQNCIEGLPDDWEMFYLSANPLNHVPNSVIPYSKNLCTVTSAFTTHSIAINHTLYDTIIQEYSKYENNVVNIVNRLTNIDGFYIDFVLPRLKTYMPKQLLFTQRCNYSDIDCCNRDINNIIIETYQQNPVLTS